MPDQWNYLYQPGSTIDRRWFECRRLASDLCQSSSRAIYLRRYADLGANNGTDAIRACCLRSDRLVRSARPAYNQADQNRPTLAQTFQPATGAKALVSNLHLRGESLPPRAAPAPAVMIRSRKLQWNAAIHGPERGQLSVSQSTADPNTRAAGFCWWGFQLLLWKTIQYFLTQGYTNLINAIIGPNAYSYNFGSQAGYLIMRSPIRL